VSAETASWLRISPGGLSVEVMARPGAPRSAVVRGEPRGLVIALAARAEKGRANQELIRLLAEIVGLSPSKITIVRGKTARLKLAHIETADPEQAARRLLACVGQNLRGAR
jgi:uncharacterized protein YggU (UPF0235/DUF167 family)